MKTNSTAKKITSIVFLCAIVTTSAVLSATVFLPNRDGGSKGNTIIDATGTKEYPAIPAGENPYLYCGQSEADFDQEDTIYKYDKIDLQKIKDSVKVEIVEKDQYGMDYKESKVEANKDNLSFFYKVSGLEVKDGDVIRDNVLNSENGNLTLPILVKVNDEIKKQKLDADNNPVDTDENIKISDCSFSLDVTAILDRKESVEVDGFSKTLYKKSESPNADLKLDLNQLVVNRVTTYKKTAADLTETKMVEKVDNADCEFTFNNEKLSYEALKLKSIDMIGSYKLEVSIKGEKGETLNAKPIYIDSYDDRQIIKAVSNASNIKPVNYEGNKASESNKVSMTKNTTTSSLKIKQIDRDGSASSNITESKGGLRIDYTLNGSLDERKGENGKVKSTITSNLDNVHYINSKGDANILVIPVLNDEDDLTVEQREKALALIQRTFFGKSEGLNYESLRSYYYKSSNKLLNIKGCVTDWFKPYDNIDFSSNLPTSLGDYNIDTKVNQVLTRAPEWIQQKTANNGTASVDWDQYATVEQARFDAVYFINSHKIDDASYGDRFVTKQGYYSDTDNSSQKIKVGNYVWTSLDYLDGNSYQKLNDNLLVESGKEHTDDFRGDAHEIIHEFGHLMGLNDYAAQATSDITAPLGKADMMDSKVGDLNAYSKMLLGWVTPSMANGQGSIPSVNLSFPDVARETSSGLASNEVKGYPVIVFPTSKTTTNNNIANNADASWSTLEANAKRFNMFDEYLMVELYSNTDLNSKGYDVLNTKNINQVGYKIYHVDARLYTKNDTTNQYELLDTNNILSAVKDNKKLYRLINNDPAKRGENIKFEEIRLLNYNERKLTKNCIATSGTMMSTIKGRFNSRIDNLFNQFNLSKYDNGEEINYELEVL